MPMVFALPSKISAQSFIIVDSRVNIVLCNSQRYAAEILVDIKLAVLDIAQPRHIQTAFDVVLFLLFEHTLCAEIKKELRHCLYLLIGGSTGVEPGDTEEFILAMKRIMRMSRVLQMLCSINYILNDEKLELKDITIFDGEQSEMTSQLESASSENELSQPVNNPQNAQNTYRLEQQILKMVRTGDTEGLTRLR